MKLEGYRIRKANSLEELQRQVRQLLPLGFIPHGDILSYYNRKKDELVFYQAMIKERAKI